MNTVAPEQKALASALVKANAEVQNATKDSNNPVHKSKYASLEEVLSVVKPVYAAHGLGIVQFPGFHVDQADGSAIVTLRTIIVHQDGETLEHESAAPVPARETRDGRTLPVDAQAVGSAITYLRRYSLAAIAGVGQEDDDGNAASRRAAAQEPAVNLADFAQNVVRLNELVTKAGPFYADLDEKTQKGIRAAHDAIAEGNVLKIGKALDWLEAIDGSGLFRAAKLFEDAAEPETAAVSG